MLFRVTSVWCCICYSCQGRSYGCYNVCEGQLQNATRLVVCRYKLPVVVIVMNNDGIYGGDRREEPIRTAAAKGAAAAGFGSDPVPTAFVPGTRYLR